VVKCKMFPGLRDCGLRGTAEVVGMDMEGLKVEKLYKHFPIGRGLRIHAVNGISFSLRQSETLALVGESGSGKTTTGRCIVHLIKPTNGAIFLEGENISLLSERKFKRLRAKIQIVFQEPYDALNPRKKISAILEDPLVNEGRLGKNARGIRVKEVLKMIDLGDEYLDKYPIQLTQGEQQRIGVARAIMTNPSVIVLDEPTSLLDIRYRAEIVALLRALQRELGITYLFISHDLVAVSQISHRIAVMYLGRIVEEGLTRTVIERPHHPYSRALLGAVLFPEPGQKKPEFVLKGEIPSPVNLPNDRCSLAPRCPEADDRCFGALPELREIGNNHYVACFKAAL